MLADMVERATNLFQDPREGRRPYAWLASDYDATPGAPIAADAPAPAMPEPVMNAVLLDRSAGFFELLDSSIALRQAENERVSKERKKIFEGKLTDAIALCAFKSIFRSISVQFSVYIAPEHRFSEQDRRCTALVFQSLAEEMAWHYGQVREKQKAQRMVRSRG